MGLELVEVASGLGFPEGPVAMVDGTLLFVDIKNQTLCRLRAPHKVEVVAELPGGPNGLAIGPDGAAYVCNNGGIYRFDTIPFGGATITAPDPYPNPYHRGGSIQRVDLTTGKVTCLYDSYQGKPLMTPDDIVFDAWGGFWFTDTGIQDPESLRKGALYYATTDGKKLVKIATIPMANGVGLSPDGKTVYISDTIFGRLWALDIADADTPPQPPRAVPGGGPHAVKPGQIPGMPGRVVQTLPALQWVDSLKVQADGRICVATILNGGITIFSPDGATEHLAVPDPFTTNLCFGGANMMDVWITASGTGKIYKCRWLSAGLPLAFHA